MLVADTFLEMRSASWSSFTAARAPLLPGACRSAPGEHVMGSLVIFARGGCVGARSGFLQVAPWCSSSGPRVGAAFGRTGERTFGRGRGDPLSAARGLPP